LQELKWIDLSWNQIESIKANIFKNNKKLEFISFYVNKIKMVHPKLFLNLNNLVEVLLASNECVNKDFGGSGESLTTLNETLNTCYSNCLDNDECAANMTETTTTTMVTTTAKLPQLDGKCASKTKFEIFENQTMT
jgi:Leucine-rich repeat (LRR) protein